MSVNSVVTPASVSYIRSKDLSRKGYADMGQENRDTRKFEVLIIGAGTDKLTFPMGQGYTKHIVLPFLERISPLACNFMPAFDSIFPLSESRKR
ncbi:MAG: hypothetical protein ACI9ON_003377 [Limisphaerales bacterium]|jgi:hypothetical protein